MRFFVLALALIPASTLAAPVPAPGLLQSIGDAIKKIPLIGAVADSIENPALLASRLQVVEGLAQCKGALQSIIKETAGGDNASVGDTANTALAGISKAQGAVDSIGKAILSGGTPQRSDQATVAQGLDEAQGSISSLASQVTTPSSKLTKDITAATSGVALAIKGGEGVLAASGLSFADVGVNLPSAGGGNAPPSPSTSSDADPIV